MAKNEKLRDFMRECIADALIALLKNKEFDKITIEEITKQAGVGRTTYFRYFENKDEIILFKLRKQWERWADEHKVLVKYSFDMNNARTFFEFEYSIRDLKTLLKDRGLTHISYESFRRILINSQETRYQDAFYAMGLFGMVEEWIKNDFKDTIEFMQNEIKTLFATPLA